MSPPKVLVIGTGEYVSGLVHGSESTSDKGAGIVALTLFDLRERGLVSDIILTGSNGTKFPLIRAHFDHLITQRYGLDTSFHSFPDDRHKRTFSRRLRPHLHARRSSLRDGSHRRPSRLERPRRQAHRQNNRRARFTHRSRPQEERHHCHGGPQTLGPHLLRCPGKTP
jgi:hypothetical protein